MKPWTDTTVVGKPLPRVDAYERVSGAAVYAVDVSFPDMLHLAILRCPHAHAVVKRVDVEVARALPGVRAVLSHTDPEASLVLPYPSWIPSGPPMRLLDPHCRYAGEEVAAVVADTPAQAREALQAVAVEYEEQPFVLDATEALKPGAPAVHEAGNVLGAPEVIQRGDVAKGLREADAVVEATYETSCQIHATMEPLASVARWDGQGLTVWESSQGVFDHQEYLATALGLPLSSVRVVCKYMGGGFGSKAELSKHTLIAALLARRTGRPVRSVLTREESFLCAGNRPSHTMTLKIGATKDGVLSAIEVEGVGVVGAYADEATGGFLATQLYSCPNVRVRETQVFVNAGKARAMRAPGFPQCAWALEQAIDALAEKVGIDAVELRLRNLPTAFQWTPPVPYSSMGLGRCLTEGARAFRWKEARARPRGSGPVRRGVGVAACMWPNPGGPPATAILTLLADGSLTLTTGVSDIGTGAKTVLAMTAAEELGLPLDRIRIEWADTATTPYAQVSGGSRTVVNNTPAVREAAAEIRRQLLEIAAEELKRPPTELLLKGGNVVLPGEPQKTVPIARLKGLQRRRALIAVGNRQPNPPRLGLPFGAQFAEVEVDTRTGEIRVTRFLAAHDSGRVMNRLTYENQVLGGVTMGIGFALTETRVLDRETGRVLNANLHDYRVPTALDVPADVTCLPVDPQDTECNTTGTKGLGEPATVPTAPAIANAVYHATGIRVTRSPITPMELLALLARKKA